MITDRNGSSDERSTIGGKKRGRKKGVKLWSKKLANLPKTHKMIRGPNI